MFLMKTFTRKRLGYLFLFNCYLSFDFNQFFAEFMYGILIALAHSIDENIRVGLIVPRIMIYLQLRSIDQGKIPFMIIIFT